MSAVELRGRGLKTNPLTEHWIDGPSVGGGVVLYVVGMCTYACSIVTRVLGLIKDIFLLIFYELARACVNRDMTHLWDRIKTVGRDFPEIGIAVIGCLCPVVAYALDEMLFDPTSECDSLTMK